MDNTKMQQLIDKQQEAIEQAKYVVLQSALGEWTIQGLTKQTPLTAQTLREWASQSERSDSEKRVLSEFLDKLNGLS